jgi:CheY-like chemotaxis protein
VALTGWGTEGDREKSLSAGFDLHLTKPVEIAAVEGVLAALPA